jgi:hypothetical protein
MTVNQTLIDEIVTNVLAKLQPAAARIVSPISKPSPAVVPVSSPSVVIPTVAEPKPVFVELTAAVITADLLEETVRPGQTLRIGRSSILTPSARDWLHSKRMAWTRQDKHAGVSGSAAGSRFRWQIILQTVTPTVRALQEGLRSLADGWKIELVGQPLEAAALATNLVSTAECDGVVVFTEHAEVIACRANRHERVRAAVMQNSKQWEQVMRTLSANVVCISPIGRSFIELRNLLRDCAAAKPRTPAGW